MSGACLIARMPGLSIFILIPELRYTVVLSSPSGDTDCPHSKPKISSPRPMNMSSGHVSLKYVKRRFLVFADIGLDEYD